MTKKFTYLGPYDAVEVPAAGVTVERGHQVEIHDPGVAASMEDQPDVWKHVPQAKPRKVTRKVAGEKQAQRAAPAPAPGISGETVGAKDAAATTEPHADPTEQEV